MTHLTAIEPLAQAKAPVLADLRDPLAALLESASAAARVHAKRRLSKLFPAAALTQLDDRFSEARCIEWDAGERPGMTGDQLFGLISATPRSVAIQEVANDLQVEVRTSGKALAITDLGQPLEPYSKSLALLAPELLRRAAEANTSIELRHFDRQCPSWAPVADDLCAVSGADIFMKMFVSGGVRSVNGWHRDKSDVLVTSVVGTKGFAVASADARDDEPWTSVVVDAHVRPGDALLMPRSRLHNATPTGEVSALLSTGFMRLADWPFREAIPTHLGYTGYPQSAVIYRLCLRSHVPYTTPDEQRLRTRIPGGIALLRSDAPDVTFAAAGTIYRSTESAVRVLAEIHSLDGVALSRLAAETGTTEPECSAIVEELTRNGLLR